MGSLPTPNFSRPDSRFFVVLGRWGFVAKGIVYCLVGLLALFAAVGLRGSVGGSKEALSELEALPLGSALLAAIAVGLFAYASYRVLQTVFDPGDEGTGVSGIGMRLTFLVSGLVHAALGVFALSIAPDRAASAGGGAGSGAQDRTAALMDQPGGRWLVALVGLVVIGFGLKQFQGVWKRTFEENYRRSEMSSGEQRLAERVGQVGLSARGVVFCMIGGFLLLAAVQADPSESIGLGGALSKLAQQSYGRVLLGFAALGLTAYGVFCFSYARYRDFENS